MNYCASARDKGPTFSSAIIWIALFFFATFCFSCNTPRALREERKMWQYETWKEQFKDRAFCLCVLEGLGSPISDSIQKYDKSFYDALAITLFDSTIKVALEPELEKISIDSMNTIGKSPADISSLHEGKKVFNHCIEFYKSNRLEQLAKEEQKKWKHIKDIMAEIHKKIPTY